MLLLLREDELAVPQDVELAVAPLGDGRSDAVRFQLGGETRRPFVVAASDGAIEDLDAHGRKA
jgi:hypothetical protein